MLQEAEVLHIALTPRAFRQEGIFLVILEISSLRMSQISSDVLKKAFATWQHAFLSSSATFYDILARTFAEITIGPSPKWRPKIQISQN